jgi:hypothetical protein
MDIMMRSWMAMRRPVPSAHRADFDRLPIIALTCTVVAGERERCVAAGADDNSASPARRAGTPRRTRDGLRDTHTKTAFATGSGRQSGVTEEPTNQMASGATSKLSHRSQCKSSPSTGQRVGANVVSAISNKVHINMCVREENRQRVSPTSEERRVSAPSSSNEQALPVESAVIGFQA